MHLGNALSKLGFRARSQLAAWAATQGLESTRNRVSENPGSDVS
jgi:hypothetical protein